MAEETLIWKNTSDNGLRSSDDGDVWDDTALVKAYDKAIAQLKGEVPPTIVNGQPHETKQRQKKRKKKKLKNEQWKVGMHCLALFEEDGLYYEGKILEINAEKRTALLEFVYYLNKEKVHFDDLLPMESIAEMEPAECAQEHLKEEKPNVNELNSGGNSDLVEGWRVSDICFIPNGSKGGFEKAVINSFTSPGHCCVTLISSNSKKDIKISHLSSAIPNGHSSSHSRSESSASKVRQFPPPFHDAPMHGPLPPQFAGLPPPMPFGSDFPPWLKDHSDKMPGMSNVKLPTFPPPPLINSGVVSGDEEALANMLMSWYMSGYHTGYYQGIQQKKQEQRGRKRQSKGRRGRRDDFSN